MPVDHDLSEARAAVLARFSWINGHADVWALAEDPACFASVTRGLARLAEALRAEAIVGIETRGVLFGAPVARELGLGFHTVRKTDGLFAGAAFEAASPRDYRGREHHMRARAALGRAGRVVLIDDWIERGSQAYTARRVVEAAGASWAGAVCIVDDRGVDTPDLEPVYSILRRADLGDDSVT